MSKKITIIVSAVCFMFVLYFVFGGEEVQIIESKTFDKMSEFQQSSDIKYCEFASDGCNVIRIIDGKFGPATQETCSQKKQYSCIEYSKKFIG